MTEADQRRHAMLLCMHNQGYLDPSDEEAAFYMRIPLDSWLKTKEVLIDRGFLEGNDSNHLTKWESRQFKTDSSADRTRRYRDRQKKSDVTSQDRHSDVSQPSQQDRYTAVTVTPPESDTDTDTEEEEEPPISPTGEGTDAETEFNLFWSAYPSKVGRKAARAKYISLRKKKLLPDIGPLLEAIEAQKARAPAGWRKWRETGSTEFIPNPATWLHQGRWEDQVDQPSPPGGKSKGLVDNADALLEGLRPKLDPQGSEDDEGDT
jgi:hypothetical protein